VCVICFTRVSLPPPYLCHARLPPPQVLRLAAARAPAGPQLRRGPPSPPLPLELDAAADGPTISEKGLKSHTQGYAKPPSRFIWRHTLSPVCSLHALFPGFAATNHIRSRNNFLVFLWYAWLSRLARLWCSVLPGSPLPQGPITSPGRVTGVATDPHSPTGLPRDGPQPDRPTRRLRRRRCPPPSREPPHPTIPYPFPSRFG